MARPKSVLHIHAKAKVDVDLSSIKEKLVGNVLLFTTIQYVDQVENMKKQIGATTIIPKRTHAAFEGQILGCTRLEDEELEGFDSILYVGDGAFHPQAAVNKELPILCYNPRTSELKTLDSKYFSQVERRKKVGVSKFYMSNEIGVIITTKFGQARPHFLNKLKKTYPNKNFYGIVFDTIEYSRLEDFSFLECYVNTACPRIGVDDDLGKPCVNFTDLPELSKLLW